MIGRWVTSPNIHQQDVAMSLPNTFRQLIQISVFFNTVPSVFS